MPDRYDPRYEAFLAMRVCELEDELNEARHELKGARTALKEYLTQHAEERAMMADAKTAAMKR
jgi:hypothetical protein